MLAQLDLVEIKRIVLCSSGLDEVLNRDQETRPAAPVQKGSAEEASKSDGICSAILEDTGIRGRESTSVRPRAGTARA